MRRASSPASYDHDKSLLIGEGPPQSTSPLLSSLVSKDESYKTKLCVFHTLQGYCIHGEDCTYAHGVDDLVCSTALLTSPPPIFGCSRSAVLKGTVVTKTASPALDLGDIYETRDQESRRRSYLQRSSCSTLLPARSGLGRGRVADYSWSNAPYMGRRWNTPSTRRPPPPEDLLSRSYSGFGNESYLSAPSIYSAVDGEINSGSCLFEFPPEGTLWNGGNAQIPQSGDVSPRLLSEVLDVLRDYSPPC